MTIYPNYFLSQTWASWTLITTAHFVCIKRRYQEDGTKSAIKMKVNLTLRMFGNMWLINLNSNLVGSWREQNLSNPDFSLFTKPWTHGTVRTGKGELDVSGTNVPMH